LEALNPLEENHVKVSIILVTSKSCFYVTKHQIQLKIALNLMLF
jgi:hypothetical protein